MNAEHVADTAPTGNRERPTLNPEAVDYRGGEYDPAPPAELLALMRRDFERERRAGRTPLNAENVRRTLATIRQQQRLAALRTRQPPAPATRARTASRTPRRPRQAPTRAVSRDGGDSGDDGPAPRPPRAGQPVGAITISDLTCLAACGYEPRAWRAVLVELRVPHAKIGRRTVCRASDWLDAVDRVSGRGEPAWDEAATIARMAGKAGAK